MLGRWEPHQICKLHRPPVRNLYLLFPYFLKLQADVSKASKDTDPGIDLLHGEEDTMVHIVSWMNCLDLRSLAILANSTLSNSRFVLLLIVILLSDDRCYRSS